jgi:hypothetical protein
MRERWRRMEQFECIAEAQRIDPQGIWAGDLLSKDDTYALREAGLVKYEGDYATLTPQGESFFNAWRKVRGALPDYPIFKRGTRQ